MKLSLALLTVLAFSGCAFADSMAYMATGSNDFGTIDLNTGSFSAIGNLGNQVSGLGEVNNTLYTGLEGTNTLYTVNTGNASLTPIGSGDVSYLVFGSTKTGLYTVDTSGGLWSINPASGASTRIGSTNILIGANNLGISTGSDTLYLAVGAQLYTVDTTTGAATALGSTGLGSVGAFVYSRGTLYGGTLAAPNAIYSFNQTNGSSTFVANVTNAPDFAWGLAPVVPEPSSFALLGLAGSLFAAYAWRRRRA